MKWLIVEDALRDRKGHWLEYVSTFVRELRALGDEVVVLCDRKAQGFVKEQTGARPGLPESIWHRMGDGAGALKRYLRVPGHAVATFFAMQKFFRGLNHTQAAGRQHGRLPQGSPKGRDERERASQHSRKDTKGEAQGDAQGNCAGAAFSNLSTSELAQDSENISLTCFASGPASALDAGRSTLDSGEAPDWIFVPTVLVHHLLGWWLLLKSGSAPGDSRVLLFFPNLPIRLDDKGKPHWSGGPTTKLMAWLFGSLRKEVESGRVVLGVETHAMRRALEGLIQMTVTYLPHPVPAKPGGEESSEGLVADGSKLVPSSATGNALDAGRSIASAAPATLTSEATFGRLPRATPCAGGLDSEASASPIVFGCYGAARWEKGSDIFLKAIRLVLQKAEKLKSLDSGRSTLDISSLAPSSKLQALRFCIQWVEDFRDDSGNLVSIDPWLREHPQVEVIKRYFEGDEYERRLAQTDVMVLPYRSPYRLRVSRVVIEAMLNGMPVIATRGTTLFEQAEEYGVVIGCQEGDAESLAEAMLGVAERFEILRASAEGKVNAAAKSFSVGYFRELLARNGLKLSTLDAGPSTLFSK